jgi:hypothetical protein
MADDTFAHTPTLTLLGAGSTRYRTDRPEASILETFENGRCAVRR